MSKHATSQLYYRRHQRRIGTFLAAAIPIIAITLAPAVPARAQSCDAAAAYEQLSAECKNLYANTVAPRHAAALCALFDTQGLDATTIKVAAEMIRAAQSMPYDLAGRVIGALVRTDCPHHAQALSQI